MPPNPSTASIQHAAMGDFFQRSLALNNNVPERSEACVWYHSVYAELGSKDHGISAGSAEVHLTVRCWNDDELEQLQHESRPSRTNWREARWSGTRDRLHTALPCQPERSQPSWSIVREAAVKRAGLKAEDAPHPFKWGEDFGLFTAEYPGLHGRAWALGWTCPHCTIPTTISRMQIIPHGVAALRTHHPRTRIDVRAFHHHHQSMRRYDEQRLASCASTWVVRACAAW